MLTFFYDGIVFQVVLCVLPACIERYTRIYILEFREIFLWRETALIVQGMKSCEKLFLCQEYAIFVLKKKNGTCCD